MRDKAIVGLFYCLLALGVAMAVGGCRKPAADGVASTPPPSSAGKAVPSADLPVIGVKEADLLVPPVGGESGAGVDSEPSSTPGDPVSLAGGTPVTVVGEPEKPRTGGAAGVAWEVVTADGVKGEITRCSLCSPSEWKRRQDKGEVPTQTICIGRDGDSKFMYGGTMSISNGAPALEPGQGVWLDPSMEGQQFGLGGTQVTGDPAKLFLFVEGSGITELAVWTESAEK